MPANVPLLVCVFLLVCFIAAPVAGSQFLTGVSSGPGASLTAGGTGHMVAHYAIMPSGSTTFPGGHRLQMQTGLTGARWMIQVVVDGNDAALQTATGSTAFINGPILSYTTNRDVSFTVTVDGTVPETANGNVTLLRMVELDNTGSTVPGSQSVITLPVTGTVPAQAAVTTTVPPVALPSGTPAATATRSPGFPASLGIAAVALAGLAWVRTRR